MNSRRSKRGSCSSGGVWRTAKRDSTGYCSSPPSTSSSLHGLPFIQPPRAPVHPASTARYSTGYCSTTPPQAPFHHLLFIQPSTPRGPIQPPLHGHPSTVYCSSSPPHHGVLFNHPSTGTPPPSTVHPALHHTTGSCSSRGNATLTVHPNPPQRSLLIPSIGFS